MNLVIILIVLILTCLGISLLVPKKDAKGIQGIQGKCSATCGALDDVNNPAYNVKEVIKNTLLIEDHLANKNKYCKECLVKHFLLSIGLLSEAIWMACDNCNKYPKLEESEKLYNAAFEHWQKHMDDEGVRLETLKKIREWRQDMIRLYYFDNVS